jgi:hypothetical protein
MRLWKSRSSAWRLALLVVIAGVGVVRLWSDAWRLHPNDPWSVSVIYRARGTGDIEYFPLISQLARGVFGEAYVYEEMGRGIMSFPVASVAPHAVLMRLFGPAGFVVADALIFASIFASLVYFLRALRVDSPWRECLAMFLVCGGQNALHQTFGTDVWSYRIPRPFVATVYLLVALTLAIRLVRSRQALGSWRTWVLLGLLLSINLQSFIYNAINLGLLLGVLALYALTRGRTRRVVWGQIMFGAVLILASCFFLAQRLWEHPDVPRRFGTFPIPRSEVLRYINVALMMLQSLIAPLVFLAASAVVVLLLDRRADRLVRLRGLAVLLLADVAATFSLPISILLIGKGIQLYHFLTSLGHFLFFTYIASVAVALDAIVRRAAPHQFRTAGYVVVALTFAWTAFWVVKDAVNPRDRVDAVRSLWSSGHYRKDFTALVRELSGPRYANDKVIATFDHQVACWWSAFRPGFLFVPDAFVTALPDEELERRLILLCKVLNMHTPQFAEFFNRQEIQELFVSHAKYQVSPAYTFSSLSDYPPEAKRVVDSITVFDTWSLMVPLSKQAKMNLTYDATTVEYATLPRLDAIVVAKQAGQDFSPSTDRFTLTYENATFRVWARKPR